MAAAIEDFSSASESIVGKIFSTSGEHTKFMRIVRRQLVSLMALGAEAELEVAPKRPKKQKADDDDSDDDPIRIEIPKPVLARIRDALADLESQPYWETIQETTKHRLTEIVKQGIEDGDPLRVIAKRIEEKLGGEGAKYRALLIARTETTGALNAGHHAAREQLIADKLVTGSEWLALEDGDTRETHVELNGTTVGEGEEFSVGGEPAPYPGWWGLSAAERANCRCTTVAAGTFAD
jgi:hypothetical protein